MKVLILLGPQRSHARPVFRRHHIAFPIVLGHGRFFRRQDEPRHLRAGVDMDIGFDPAGIVKCSGMDKGKPVAISSIVTPHSDPADGTAQDDLPLPLGEGMGTSLGSPESTVTRSVSIRALTARALPDWRWHQVQWQP